MTTVYVLTKMEITKNLESVGRDPKIKSKIIGVYKK
jgi:hypothetical protein